MKFFIHLFAFIAVISIAHAEEIISGSISAYNNNQKYEYLIKKSALEKSPKWNEDEQNPPLSPRSAVNIAENTLKIYIPETSQWKLNQLTLRKVSDSWVYVVSFIGPHPKGQYDGIVSTFEIPVVFDGTSPLQTITAFKMQP